MQSQKQLDANSAGSLGQNLINNPVAMQMLTQHLLQ